MKRRTIAAIVVLLMSVQAFGAVALCLLPCCAPAPTQCPQHEQAPKPISHAHHHHAGMQSASTTKVSASKAPHCVQTSLGAVADLRRAAPTDLDQYKMTSAVGAETVSRPIASPDDCRAPSHAVFRNPLPLRV